MDLGPRHPALGLDTQKKTLRAAERDEAHRATFRAQLREHPADVFVLVDETGSNLNLTRRYGRAPHGARAIGSVPRNTPPNTTLIAAMTTAGMGAAMVLDGATDTLAFDVYIEHVLAPTLCTGQIVVMDNLSAHKSSRVRRLIEARGCALWYLPSYSPDLSPIEEAFSKLKTLLRGTAARTKDALVDAIAAALTQITSADARGYFWHCGYRLRPVSNQ